MFHNFLGDPVNQSISLSLSLSSEEDYTESTISNYGLGEEAFCWRLDSDLQCPWKLWT